ncbi:hypothetical protein HRR83_002419 [Exophiala dermatitidis]|uniref:Uncharacterized protein n=1 Tax=Exophiala dermatitidis TaxID=5970 RepID=A0AAN6IZF1_EXODE|nr:hypothetical protein HRR74_002497 [Exophiala dermatitidis]KAJ4525428.1 hypothetical protein HRR73_002158 [Exophiala dermatitidis]KAJ4536743.1 hypothetical protein HRR76_004770 [Exophiala dermatitidis]KAJ4555654.1 hypothetical protein HRR77_001583 [Exophiala dermatitidis]KAJ4568957.1 hypothetical protein HRR81_006614 [Exophiala dermatitidis]
MQVTNNENSAVSTKFQRKRTTTSICRATSFTSHFTPVRPVTLNPPASSAVSALGTELRVPAPRVGGAIRCSSIGGSMRHVAIIASRRGSFEVTVTDLKGT